MAQNTYGRSIIVALTNKSGGSVALGDVVVVDTTTDESFTTTTSAANTSAIGVAAETIASNAVGRVVVGGYVSLVNVNASVTRNQFGTTHTVAKQAVASASRVAGTFCRWLMTSATPSAYIYPVDLAGSALTNPMTTAGDIIVGGAAGAPARLAAGTAGYPLVGGGAGVAPAYARAATLVGCRVEHSTTQSVAQNTFVALTFDTESSPYYDTDAIHAGTDFTAIVAGKWMVGCTMQTDLPASSANILTIYVNGTELTGTRDRFPTASVTHTFQVHQPLLLALNDVVTFRHFQGSAGSYNAGDSTAGARTTAYMYFMGV